MQLSLNNFTTLVSNFASSVQGACASLVDFSVGSVLRAVGEATASAVLWLQWMILQVLSTTRAATSVGSDLDTWMADYGLTRLPATYATGSVTFTRFTATSQAFIPADGSITVKTADGTQAFTVIADASQSAYSASLGGYVIASGIASANVTVRANNSGSQGDVQAGTITLLASAIPYVDTVTNGSNFTNGIDAESDAAFYARFQNYIQTRCLGTVPAIKAAIANVQQGLQCTVYENSDTSGNFVPGNVVVMVDDGTGSPSSSLLALCSAAMPITRAIGTSVVVIGPSDTTVTVVATYSTTPAASKTAAMTAAVQAAIVAFINATPDNAPIVYQRLGNVIFSVDPSISDVPTLTINGGMSDIPAPSFGVLKTSLTSVSVS
jgi:uncharacterized phage protein gp47/JayE